MNAVFVALQLQKISPFVPYFLLFYPLSNRKTISFAQLITGQSDDTIFANYTLAICNAQAGSAEKAVTYIFAAKV
jgi:hypothetical protein